MTHDAHVVVETSCFGDDLDRLTGALGFRLDATFPADAPHTAIVSGHGVSLRLQASSSPQPITIHLLGDEAGDDVHLPGGTRIERRAATTALRLPDNAPRLVVTHDDGASGVGRAGMRYRDLIPDRWGGRFIASHITIPDGGPIPDYVHFHRIRFQLIFVKRGWVRVVYENQGEPFVMEAGDAVLQPPEIRHRVLESSPGLEVIEIGCPAEHETFADHALDLPTAVVDRERDFGGQRFVRHVAAQAGWTPWRIPGWEHRDTGIETATRGLAGVRVARPAGGTHEPAWVAHDTEFAFLVVLDGEVDIEIDGDAPVRLRESSSVAIPGGLRYRLGSADDRCELLDVTLPGSFDVLGAE